MEKKGSDHFRDMLNPYGEKSNYGKIGRRRRLSKLNVFFSIILSVTIMVRYTPNFYNYNNFNGKLRMFNHGGIPLINTTKNQWKTAALDVLRCQMLQLLLAKPVAGCVDSLCRLGHSVSSPDISWYLLIVFVPPVLIKSHSWDFSIFNIDLEYAEMPEVAVWHDLCQAIHLNSETICFYLFLHCVFWVYSSRLMGHSSTVSSQLVARSIIISPMAKELQKKGKDKAAMEPAKCLVFKHDRLYRSIPGIFPHRDVEAQQSARRSKVFFWLQTYWNKPTYTLPYSTTLLWCADVDLISSVLDHFFSTRDVSKNIGRSEPAWGPGNTLLPLDKFGVW